VSDVVRQLQRDLTALGFPCGVIDGANGPATRTAVARFQLAYGWSRLTVDGQYGPQTLGAMSHATDDRHGCPRTSVWASAGRRVTGLRGCTVTCLPGWSGCERRSASRLQYRVGVA
jgi:hypothetical protein